MRNAMLVVLLALPVGWIAFAQPEKQIPPAPESFSSAKLGTLLKEMGYEPKSLSPDVYQVSVDREGWKVHIMVSLTREADRIWMECKFAPIVEPALAPSSAWLRLLEENERISPAHFTFDKTDKRLHVYKSFETTQLSPMRLKKELDGFDDVIRRTQSIWRIENFVHAEDLAVSPRSRHVEALTIEPRIHQPEQAESAFFQGKWQIVRIESNGKSLTQEKLVAFKPSLVVEGDKAVLKLGIEPERAVRVKIDAGQRPKRIDLTDQKGRVDSGIYMVEAGLLTICFAGPGEERPRQFVTDSKNKTWLLVLKRLEP